MKNVVVIGFMGAGKSSTGRMLASRLGCAFLDLDRHIEKQEQKTVSEIFAEKGEDYFRRCERKAVQEIMTRKNIVVATGGGTVKDEENRRLFKDWGVMVCLTANAEVIYNRTNRRGKRPVLDALDGDRQQAIKDLMKSREDIYAHADYFVDTSELSPLQVVEEIMRYLRREGARHA